MNTIGLRIERLRDSRKYTQEYMAECLGVSQNTYSRYESGDIEPKLTHLRRMAEVFEVPVEELLRTEPVVVNMSHNETANNVVHQQNNVPRDLFEKLSERYEARVAELERINQRLMDMLERLIKQQGE